MKAAIVKPGHTNSAALIEINKPTPKRGEVLVRVLEVGIDSTDIEIKRHSHGEAPQGENYLILGHEALGTVEETNGTNFKKGDLVIPLIRRPGKCTNCLRGQSDMCTDNDYRDSGIKGAHGFLREYFAEEPAFLIKAPQALKDIAVFTSPTSIVVKGMLRSMELHGHSSTPTTTTLIVGAGLLGLLSAAFLRLHGYNSYVLDILPETGFQAQLLEEIGVTYIDGRTIKINDLPQEMGNPDIIIQTNTNSAFFFQALPVLGANGVMCIMGVSTNEQLVKISDSVLSMKIMLGNKTVFGSISSGRSHYERALGALGAINKKWPGWLNQLITRRLSLSDFHSALEPSNNYIKTVVTMT